MGAVAGDVPRSAIRRVQAVLDGAPSQSAQSDKALSSPPKRSKRRRFGPACCCRSLLSSSALGGMSTPIGTIGARALPESRPPQRLGREDGGHSRHRPSQLRHFRPRFKRAVEGRWQPCNGFEEVTFERPRWRAASTRSDHDHVRSRRARRIADPDRSHGLISFRVQQAEGAHWQGRSWAKLGLNEGRPAPNSISLAFPTVGTGPCTARQCSSKNGPPTASPHVSRKVSTEEIRTNITSDLPGGSS